MSTLLLLQAISGWDAANSLLLLPFFLISSAYNRPSRWNPRRQAQALQVDLWRSFSPPGGPPGALELDDEEQREGQ